MSNKKLDVYSNYNEYFKNFLGGWTFENGDEIVTITDVTTEEMYDSQNGGKKQAPCLHFKEKQLPMVLNKTNADMVAKVTGSDIPNDWKGKQIKLGQSKVKAFGKESLAIRVRDEVITTNEPVQKVVKEQLEQIQGLIDNGAITNVEAMLQYYNVSKLEDLSQTDAANLIKAKTQEVNF